MSINHAPGSINDILCKQAGKHICHSRATKKKLIEVYRLPPPKQVIDEHPISREDNVKPQKDEVQDYLAILEAQTIAQAKIESDARLAADKQLLEKLAADYEDKLHALKHDQDSIKEIMQKEREMLEQLESSKQEQDRTIEIKANIESNLKKISSIKKKAAAQSKQDKIDRLVAGKSTIKPKGK